MSALIRKAVFPVAGMGTRFLPATKANPKEMLPIVDKPLIQYAVEEAIVAGMTELIFVTSSSKRAIEDHFDVNYELEARLRESEQHDLLKMVQNILPRGVSCAYVRQPEALGLGHAVWCAKTLVGHEPFAVILADDLIHGKPNCLQQMCELYAQTQANILAVEEVPLSETRRYGIVDTHRDPQHRMLVKGIVEKPKPALAPSRLAVVGRYLLHADIFPLLENATPGIGGEIQLTDAIATLLLSQSIYALPFKGIRYDCGTKLGYLAASIDYALEHPEIGKDFKQYLENRFEITATEVA
jgi:UTP--glucose-1-phosphate uridylyltransferase